MTTSARVWPQRGWRRLRRIRRSNVVPALGLITVLIVFFAVDFDPEAEVFESPPALARSRGTPIIIPPGDPILLGYAGPMTGALAELGNEPANAGVAGALHWRAEHGDTLHGHPFLLVGEDDGGTETDIAQDAAHLLIERPGLVLVLGPAFSTAAASAIPIFGRAGVVMVSGSATRTDLTLTQEHPVFFFRTAFTNAIEGPLQAQLLLGRAPPGTAVLVDDAEAYGIDLANSAAAGLVAEGWIVRRASAPRGTVDFAPVIDEVLESNATAVVFEGFNPEGPILLRQLRDAGYTGLFVGGDGVVSQHGFLDVLGPLAEGALLTGCPPPLTAEFLEVWEAAGAPAAPSTAFAGPSADAAYILIEALAAVAEPRPDGSLLIDPLALRAAVAATDTTGWATGQPIAFDEHGDRLGAGAAGGLVACEVRDGQFVEITP